MAADAGNPVLIKENPWNSSWSRFSITSASGGVSTGGVAREKTVKVLSFPSALLRRVGGERMEYRGGGKGWVERGEGREGGDGEEWMDWGGGGGGGRNKRRGTARLNQGVR